MAADSPKRSVRCIPAVVPPQAVNDRSIIDSVAGFINDVALTNQPQGDPKDAILWARFETLADISDPTFGEDWELEGGVAPPLLLILGYGSGVQVWSIPANGEAVEVLSWRHGIVKALRILPTPISSDAEMAEEPIDQFAHKRPLMAICDSAGTGSGPQFCSINFVSLKDGDQVKTIKFKNPIVDILANRTSIAVTFCERIAVFDARNFEDRLTVTTCHPSPGINPNPIALGSRWMAYAERKLLPSKRSSGGCDCDGVSSYTATVLNAAKSLGKGLREFGEQVAAGLTGSSGHASSGSIVRSGSTDSASGTTDLKQPGVVTILDIKNPIKETSPTTGAPVSSNGSDPIVAHFIAHSDAIVALSFDNSGMLLVSADKRGHDFHIFRIHPHPGGPQLAAVHHLYVLHRGDTSAKVQDITFSLDSRWVAISTLRGTTHVFPVTPYGGPAGARTHGSLHVVNRLSRFHRSAGLSIDGRSSSPVFHSECSFSQSYLAYNNPRTPPFPRPTVVLPLAQLRQPSVLGTPPGSAQNSYSKSSHGRQRVSSLSDDTGKPLRVCAIFAKARSWLLDPPNLTREIPAHRMQRKAVDSLFIMAGHGALIQYDLDAKHAANVPKEKVCDDTPIELEVEAKAQWILARKDSSSEIQPPLPNDSWLLKDRLLDSILDVDDHMDRNDDRDDRWLSQVEIITHAGPHRRLWMGPQFTFKTYNTPSGSPLNHIDVEAIEVGVSSGGNRPARSNPMNMPHTTSSRSAVPVLIESGSCSSFEQSPRLMDKFRHEHMDSDYAFTHGDNQLKEDLADAMRESPAVQFREAGKSSTGYNSSVSSSTSTSSTTSDNNKSNPLLNPLVNKSIMAGKNVDMINTAIKSTNINSKITINNDTTTTTTNTTTNTITNTTIPNIIATTIQNSTSSDSNEKSSNMKNVKDSQQCQSSNNLSWRNENVALQKPTSSHASLMPAAMSAARSVVLIEKVVNPLGTVTTITHSPSPNDYDVDSQYMDFVDDYIIHENCDEALFRPVVAIIGGTDDDQNSQQRPCDEELPAPISTELIVPVIEEKSHEVSPSRSPNYRGKLVHEKTEDPPKCSQNPSSNFSSNPKKNKNTAKKTVSKAVKLLSNKETDDIKSSTNKESLQIITEPKNDQFEESPKVDLDISIRVALDSEKKSKLLEEEKPHRIEESKLEEISCAVTEPIVTATIKLPSEKRRNKVSSNESKSVEDDPVKCELVSKVDLSIEQKESKTSDTSSDLNEKKKAQTHVEEKTNEKIDNDSSKKAASTKVGKLEKFSKGKKDVVEKKTVEDVLEADKEKSAPNSPKTCLKNKQSINLKSIESDVTRTKSKTVQICEDNSNDNRREMTPSPLQFWEKFAHENSKEIDTPTVSVRISKKKNNDKIVTMTSVSGDTKTESIDSKIPSESKTLTADYPELTPTLATLGTDEKDKKSRKTKVGVSPNISSLSTQKNANKIYKEKSQSLKVDNDPLKVDNNSVVPEVISFSAILKNKSSKTACEESPIERDIETSLVKISPVTDESSSKSSPTSKSSSSSNSPAKQKSSRKSEKNPGTTTKDKTIDFPELSLDSLPTDFSDEFLPPLSPLEPFEPKFENLHFKDSNDDTESLIIFESPLQERSQPENINEKSSKSKRSPTKSSAETSKNFDKNNLIFAMCGSLHDTSKDEEDLSENKLSANKRKSTVKCSRAHIVDNDDATENAEDKSLDIDESYLSLEPTYPENTSSSSSEETEESCCNIDKKLVEDDEELRPLIGGGGTSSTCSISPSIRSKKKTSQSIALEIAKAISDTLPERPSSDSDDRTNILNDGDLDESIVAISSGSKNSKTQLTADISRSQIAPSDSGVRDQMSISTPGVGTANNNQNTNGNGNGNGNGKKKPKKKKR